MKEFQLNDIRVDAVILKFECPHCRHKIVSDPIMVPEPDYSAETGAGSVMTNEDTIVCERCAENYDVEIVNSYNGGYGKIGDVNDDMDVIVEEL